MSRTPLSLDLRALAMLLEQRAGLSQALDRLGSRPGGESYQKAAEQVRAGASLGQAALAWPEWVREIIAAEQNCNLPDRLRRCASLWDEHLRRLSFWRNVLVYPVLLWIGCISVGGVVSLICQSQFALLDLSGTAITDTIRLVTSWYLRLLPVWILSPVALWLLLSKQSVRARFPILGFLARQRDAASFLGWLELSLEDGRPLPEALVLASSGCVLAPIRREMLETARRCKEGSGLGEAVSSLVLWPPLGRWALVQSEQTQFRPQSMRGLARILQEKADFYEIFLTTVLTLVTYLVAGGILLIWSLCALVPVNSVMGNL